LIVLDTHVWVWWVHADPRLTPEFQRTLDAHEQAGLGVSAISCWEVAKLIEYKPVPRDAAPRPPASPG
jgi:PIN domain nuclease of toxin-antitoxin system